MNLGYLATLQGGTLTGQFNGYLSFGNGNNNR